MDRPEDRPLTIRQQVLQAVMEAGAPLTVRQIAADSQLILTQVQPCLSALKAMGALRRLETDGTWRVDNQETANQEMSYVSAKAAQLRNKVIESTPKPPPAPAEEAPRSPLPLTYAATHRGSLLIERGDGLGRIELYPPDLREMIGFVHRSKLLEEAS